MLYFTLAWMAINMVFTTPTPASPEEEPTWIFEETNNIGDKFYYALKLAVRKGDMVYYKEKIVYGPILHRDLSTMEGKPIYKDIRDAEINCSQKTIQRGYFKPQPIEPDSPMAAVMKALCQVEE